MRKWLAPLVLPLLGASALVLVVVLLGRGAKGQLRDQDRYDLVFADIDCTPPHGLSRADFLNEVQFLSAWPDRHYLLDPDLPGQLADAFARHPWVKRVDRVNVAASGVCVLMTYRIPVLAVPRRGADGPLRAVDENAILLPLAAVAKPLPLLEGDVPAPAGGAGSAWGDPQVEAAAAVAAVIDVDPEHQRVQRLRVQQDDVWLKGPNVSIHWGRPPGQERPGEPPMTRKLARLRQAMTRPELLASIDLAKE